MNSSAEVTPLVPRRLSVYVFLGSDADSVRYSGIVRVGADALEDWPGSHAADSLPVLNMNWTWTPFLYYSFCE